MQWKSLIQDRYLIFHGLLMEHNWLVQEVRELFYSEI